MTAATDAQIQHIYQTWHHCVVARDLEGLMALYTPDATFESPLLIARPGARSAGVLHGNSAIRDFFAESFQAPENGLGRWYRSGTFFANGRQLVWEYPRETPEGEQVDLVEFMDIADGRISHHRVYWGWVGFKTLLRQQAPQGPLPE